MSAFVSTCVSLGAAYYSARRLSLPSTSFQNVGCCLAEGPATGHDDRLGDRAAKPHSFPHQERPLKEPQTDTYPAWDVTEMIAAAFLHPHDAAHRAVDRRPLGCRRADPDFRAAVSTIWPASSGTPYRRFVAGLCVMVGTLVKTGVIGDLPDGRERNGAAVRCRPGDEHSRFVVRLEGSSTAVPSRLTPAWAQPDCICARGRR